MQEEACLFWLLAAVAALLASLLLHAVRCSSRGRTLHNTTFSPITYVREDSEEDRAIYGDPL